MNTENGSDFPEERVSAQPSPEQEPAERPPRVWTSFAVFVLAVVAQVPIGMAVWALVGDPVDGDTPTWALPVAILVAEGVFAALAIVAASLSPVPTRTRLGLLVRPVPWHLVLVAVVGGLSLDRCLETLMALGVIPEPSINEMLGEILPGLPVPLLIATIAIVGIGPGIAEELLFRGYIQTRLVKRWGCAAGILVTSILFGLIHMEPAHAVYAAIMGVFLGLVAERAGTIWPAMVSHASINAGSGVLLSTTGAIEGVTANLAILVTGLILLAASLWHLARARASR